MERSLTNVFSRRDPAWTATGVQAADRDIEFLDRRNHRVASAQEVRHFVVEGSRVPVAEHVDEQTLGSTPVQTLDDLQDPFHAGSPVPRSSIERRDAVRGDPRADERCGRERDRREMQDVVLACLDADGRQRNGRERDEGVDVRVRPEGNEAAHEEADQGEEPGYALLGALLQEVVLCPEQQVRGSTWDSGATSPNLPGPMPRNGSCLISCSASCHSSSRSYVRRSRISSRRVHRPRDQSRAPSSAVVTSATMKSEPHSAIARSRSPSPERRHDHHGQRERDRAAGSTRPHASSLAPVRRRRRPPHRSHEG